MRRARKNIYAGLGARSDRAALVVPRERAQSGSMGLGWEDENGGGAGSPYTGIPPSPATTIGEELDWRANHVGSAVVITSFEDLEALFPAVGGLHTINTTAKFTSFDALPPGNHIEIVFPGSINTDQSLAVLLVGDYAGGPLLSGEIVIDSIAVLNVNPAGTDAEFLSPVGRAMGANSCFFLGQGGVEIKAAGNVVFDSCLWKPAAPGAAGLQVSSTLGGLLMTDCLFAAPGTSPYTGFTVAASATISQGITCSNTSFSDVLPTDALFSFAPGATYPGGGAVPAIVAGIRINDSNVLTSTGVLFAAGSLDELAIELVATGGAGNAPDTRLLGDAFVSVAGAAINMDFGATVPGVDVVVPASNGVGDTLTLQSLSSHFTLDVSDINNWWLRYDGPDSSKTAGVQWYFEFLKSGAADLITGIVYRDTGGGGGFQPEDESSSAERLAPTALPVRAIGATPVIMNSGDKIQIRASSKGTSAISINRIKLIQEKTG